MNTLGIIKNGTKIKIPAVFVPEPWTGAGRANGLVYREEISEITADMWTSIADGSFSKVHAGMHYTATSGRTYWFAHADYYLGFGKTEQTSHHMLVVEDKIQRTVKANSTLTSSGGAQNSLIYTSTLPTYQTELETDFGQAHIISQNVYLTNNTSGEAPTGGSWVTKSALLLNVTQVFGHQIGQKGGTGQWLNALSRDKRVILFDRLPDTIIGRMASDNTRVSWWCDDVMGSISFGCVFDDGHGGDEGANVDYGLRRAFLIG